MSEFEEELQARNEGFAANIDKLVISEMQIAWSRGASQCCGTGPYIF